MLVTILILWSNNWIYFRLDKREKVKKNTVKYLYVSFHFKDSLFLSPPLSFSVCVCTHAHESAPVETHKQLQSLPLRSHMP